jgi:hypothetical protein
MTAYPARSLNDDRDGQVHIVGVDKAHSYSRVAGKCRMNSIVCQNLCKQAYTVTHMYVICNMYTYVHEAHAPG